MTGPISILVADDEPLARERLTTLLAGHPELSVIAECGDGEEAAARMVSDRPDLAFLDVQMPELDGFGALEAAAPWHVPEVVFVTAYDAYALRAFEAGAIDYLLKPFDRPRFERALTRALARLASPGREAEVRALLARVAADRGTPERLAIRVGRRIRFVEVSAIEWIEAAGNYARLRAGGATHLLRERMRELERRLDPRLFVRIHRSFIVNVGAIAALEPTTHGEFQVSLRDGTKLTSSRTFSERLRQLGRC